MIRTAQRDIWTGRIRQMREKRKTGQTDRHWEAGDERNVKKITMSEERKEEKRAYRVKVVRR